MPPNPKTGFVTLPEVVTGELTGKFGEISLFNHHADFELESASNSNPLSEFYSNPAYEFDFGSDPEEPESEDNFTEHPLSGPASGLVITSTPAGRFVYWPDRKPADLIRGDSRYVAYIDSLPFQEGTPLARADSSTPTEVAPSESSLGTPTAKSSWLLATPQGL
jgi:hypothetical protein